MSFSCDTPQFYCLVRSEYLYDLRSHRGEFIPCLVYAVDSVESRATGFEILTDIGALFSRLPISALVHRMDAPNLPLDWLQLWGNFSYDIEAIEHQSLRHLRVRTLLKDRKWYDGRYLFTLRWKGSKLAEDPGEGGFKTGEVLQLDNGCYAIQPKNRIRVYEPSFVTKPFPEKPDFLTNSHTWLCESTDKWATESSDRYFYETGPKHFYREGRSDQSPKGIWASLKDRTEEYEEGSDFSPGYPRA